MSAFRIELAPSAYRALGKLDPQIIRKRVEPHISALADEPRPIGSKRLAGAEELHRIRVGAYRIVYRIEDDVLVVLVLKLGHRRDVYGDA
jgi:mRNA interferase RelE/StbE